jgi:hypothetical protein
VTASDDVLTALDQEWRTARDVHARAGCWALPTIKYLLNNHAEKGTIEAKVTKNPNGILKEYRRKLQRQPEAEPQ